MNPQVIVAAMVALMDGHPDRAGSRLRIAEVPGGLDVTLTVGESSLTQQFTEWDFQIAESDLDFMAQNPAPEYLTERLKDMVEQLTGKRP